MKKRDFLKTGGAAAAAAMS
ncbi:MAG: twin-arginine translocation signal domain-containing protein, partial [Burkholderiaceae bacterium]|nr:twin-arginine translocation signal domain-containing protein [Burkholderiaceae bacterium]